MRVEVKTKVGAAKEFGQKERNTIIISILYFPLSAWKVLILSQ